MSQAQEPRWSVPSPYGYTGAVEGMGSVASPLLAGFSITLAVLVITNATAFRWVSATLFLLVAATLALIATVQFTFRARQYVVTPSEIEEWWPDHQEPGRRELLRREQRWHRREYESWSSRARYAYDLGLLLLLLGIAALLVPASGLHYASNGRLAAIALALAGLAAEAAWIVRTTIWRPAIRNWPPPPGPEL